MPLVTPNEDGEDRSLRRLKSCHIDDLLGYAASVKAADLHLATGMPPVVRVEAKLFQAPYEHVTAETSERLVYDILSDEQIREFETGTDLDFTYSDRRAAAYRVKVFRHKGTITSVFHAVK